MYDGSRLWVCRPQCHLYILYHTNKPREAGEGLPTSRRGPKTGRLLLAAELPRPPVPHRSWSPFDSLRRVRRTTNRRIPRIAKRLTDSSRLGIENTAIRRSGTACSVDTENVTRTS